MKNLFFSLLLGLFSLSSAEDMDLFNGHWDWYENTSKNWIIRSIEAKLLPKQGARIGYINIEYKSAKDAGEGAYTFELYKVKKMGDLTGYCVRINKVNDDGTTRIIGNEMWTLLDASRMSVRDLSRTGIAAVTLWRKR